MNNVVSLKSNKFLIFSFYGLVAYMEDMLGLEKEKKEKEKDSSKPPPKQFSDTIKIGSFVIDVRNPTKSYSTRSLDSRKKDSKEPGDAEEGDPTVSDSEKPAPHIRSVLRSPISTIG